MKTNQLKLPFGQWAKQTKSRNTKTGTSPIRISDLKAHGIATATSLSAEAILELGKRYDQEAYIIYGALQNPNYVYTTFKDEMDGLPETTYNIIAVNTKNMVTVTKLFPSLPTIRQIMRWTVSNSAAALFVCRNATGTPTISYEEELFMVELSDAGGIVGIDLLDFIVIGASNYASGRVENIL
jgi:DNA repair protein RadC